MGLEEQKDGGTSRMSTKQKVICTVLCALIIFGIGAFIASLALNKSYQPPREFQMNSLTVDHFDVSYSGDSASKITGNWSIVMSIKNPNNEEKIWYNCFVLVVSYNDETIAGVEVEPFDQNAHKKTLVNSTLSYSSASVSSQVAQGIQDELNKRGVVKFEVIGQTIATVYGYQGDDHANHYEINIACENLEVGFSLNKRSTVGSMLQQTPLPCKVSKHKIYG